jgi:hypothetical protein
MKWTLKPNSHMPCRAHAVLCPELDKSLSEGHGRGMARARNGMCNSNTAVLCNSNGKDTIQILSCTSWQGNGMGTELGTIWSRHGNGMVCVNYPLFISPSTSPGQRNCASWASQNLTLRPQPGGETTKSITDMWWHWGEWNFASCEWGVPSKAFSCPPPDGTQFLRHDNLLQKSKQWDS